MTVDAIDRRILRALQTDSRQTVAEIGAIAGLSPSACHRRIRNLEQAGVIAGYTVRIHDEHARSQVRAHVMLTVGPKLTGTVEAALRRIPEVRALLSVSGGFDLIAIVQAESIERLDALIDAIGLLDGVERTNTAVVLSTRIDR